MTATATTAATTHVIFFDSNRRTRDQSGSLVMVPAAGTYGGRGGIASALPELPPTSGSDVAVEAEWPGRVSRGLVES
jgi:hypothetical protein